LSELVQGTAASAAVPLIPQKIEVQWFPHYLRAMRAIVWRELSKFLRQYGRHASANVRPTLWLLVVGAGMSHILGFSTNPPYRTYTTFQEYIVPSLVAMVILFNGMQSSLSLVYDREVGTMRLMLTAPLPRWYILFCKLVAGAVLSVIQSYAFVALAGAVGVYVPWGGWLLALPILFLAGLMMGAIGLLLSVYIRQLENFAGTMNFVIFPMFFISPSLFPIWFFQEVGSDFLYWAASVNPFTHAMELIRFTVYGESNPTSLWVVIGTTVVCFLLAVIAYDPQRGLIRRRKAN
jgi:ABC-2 type transport system permease protein